MLAINKLASSFNSLDLPCYTTHFFVKLYMALYVGIFTKVTPRKFGIEPYVYFHYALFEALKVLIKLGKDDIR